MATIISSVTTTGITLGSSNRDLIITRTGAILTSGSAIAASVSSNASVTLDGDVVADRGIDFLNPRNFVTIGETGTIHATEAGISVGKDNIVKVAGQVTATNQAVDEGAAILLNEIGNTVTVTATGSLTGNYGILTDGTGDGNKNMIVNDGTINAITVAIYLKQNGTFAPTLATAQEKVTNTGTILSDKDGIIIDKGGNVLNTGLIQVGSTAVLFGNASTTTSFTNTGVVIGTTAFKGSTAGAVADTVVNSGRMEGIIDLGSGNDLYDGRLGTVKGQIKLGDGSDTARGGEGNESIDGGNGDDLIDGGTGADSMTGGAGDDLYVVDDVGDIVAESQGGGTDTVRASISYVLASDVENLVLTGSADLNGTGNNLANDMLGNDGGNTLDGKAGADVMRGGNGDDIYIVDDSNDVVTEGTDGGVDIVRANASFALSANVENLVLLGTGQFTGRGNDLANTIIGNAGSNELDGGGGADLLIGGDGGDSYQIDHEGDVIVEGAGGGQDLVFSTVSYDLTENVEGLFLFGTDHLSGRGNALANLISGNSGNNTLDGGAGADILFGGVGDDTYVIDDGGDSYAENINEGTDTIISSISHHLFSDTENLILTGTDNLSATGNELANKLTGNSGNNLLEGAEGADVLDGKEGRDIAVFSGTRADYTIEKINTGSYVITDNVGQDGADVLLNIEEVRFSDGTFSLTNVAPSTPAIVAGSLIGLAENQTGQAVVARVQASDDGEGGALRYELVGNPGGLFAVDASGNITFTGGAIDYETNPHVSVDNEGQPSERKFFRVVVKAVEDGPNGLSSNDTVIEVNVADENEAPLDATYLVEAMTQGAAEDTHVGTLQSVIDPDTRAAFQDFRFTLVDANGAAIVGDSHFKVDALSGEIKVGKLGLPAAASASDVNVYVRVTDMAGAGLSHVEAVTVHVNPPAGPGTNNQPSDPVLQAGSLVHLSENRQGQVAVATVQANDGDGGAAHFAFANGGNPGGLFAIDHDTGVITYIGGPLDYETTQNLTVENQGLASERKFFRVVVKAVEDGPNGLSSNDTVIEVNVADENEAPLDATYLVGVIAHGAAEDTHVGTLQSVTDPDTRAAFQGFRFTLVDANGAAIVGDSHFKVDALTGEIKVGKLGLPNFAAPTDTQLRVRITDRDGAGLSHVETVTVRIAPGEPVNTPPENPQVQGGNALHITENQAGPLNVATMHSNDDGVGGTTLQYSIVQNQNPGNLFVIDQATGVITFTGTAQDYETNANLTVENAGTPQEKKYFAVVVKATESGAGGRASGETLVKVYLDDVNETVVNVAPSNIALTAQTVQELAAADSVVGTFSATDADANETFTYSLVGTDERFEIVGNQLKVKNGFKLDFEQVVAHDIRVRVADKAGASFEKVFSIGVLDMAPEFTAGSFDDDIFKGGASHDTLFGNLGNDAIYGGAGNDVVSGDAGNDRIFGGLGKDVMTGGAGNDTFVFDARVDKKNWKLNVDKVVDYNVKQDSIFLDNAVFTKLGKKGTLAAPAKLNKAFFTVGTAAKDKNDYVIFDDKKKVLYYDADGSGKGAAYQIAIFKTKLKMAAGEFFVI